MVVLFLISWGTSTLFSTVHQFTFPSTAHKGSLFTPSPALVSLVSLITAIPTGVRRHLTVVLICISLMISHVHQLFMYLLFTYMSSMGKCLFRFRRALLITVRWKPCMDRVCTFWVQRSIHWSQQVYLAWKKNLVIFCSVDPRAKVSDDSRCDVELNNSPINWYSTLFHILIFLAYISTYLYVEIYSGLILW